MPIKLISPGGGSVTIDVPSTANTVTLTAPAQNANLITSADTGTVSQAMMAANSVAQAQLTNGAVTQAKLAAGVAGNGPAFSAWASSTISIGSFTWTRANYDTKEFDTSNCFNNTSSTATLNGLSVPAYAFCPNVEGYYMIIGSHLLSSTITTFNSIYKNGGLVKTGNIATTQPSYNSEAQVSAVVYLNGTGDYVQIYVNAASSTTVAASQSGTIFQAFLARAA